MFGKAMWRSMGLLTLGALVLGSAAAVAVRAQDAEDDGTEEAKAIFLDGSGDKGGKPAMKFNVMLDRGGSKKRVRTSYDFKSKDRMKFEFEVNKPQYVYVLTRTLPADRRYQGAKGIGVVRDEDRRNRGGDNQKYKLLFPTKESGSNNKLAAGKVHSIPTAAGTWFTMDNQPGIEKLYVVLSSQPIKVDRYFDLASGSQRRSGSGRGKDMDEDGKSIPHADDEDEAEESEGKEADDILDDLNKDLSEWADNADIAEAKGINTESYGSSRNPARPMMIEVDLTHNAK